MLFKLPDPTCRAGPGHPLGSFPANPKLFRRLDDVAECAAFGWMAGTSPGLVPAMTALVS
jgi:hypothetical protein